MRDGGGASLEFLANFAKLRNEFRGLTNRLIGGGNFLHRFKKLGLNVRSAVFTEKAVFVGIVSEISVETRI